jgi:hypothetical protein
MFTTLVKAKAKLVKNKKLDTLRLIVAFNVYEENAMGTLKFPTPSKCDYVSGDLTQGDVLAAMDAARRAVRADIELVS